VFEVVINSFIIGFIIFINISLNFLPFNDISKLLIFRIFLVDLTV
jgi:hypothetical protein